MKRLLVVLTLLTVGLANVFAQTYVSKGKATEVFDVYKETIADYFNENKTYAKYGDVVYEEEVQITSAKNIKILNSLMSEIEEYLIEAENGQLTLTKFTKVSGDIAERLYIVWVNNCYCAAWIVLDDSYNFEFTEKELELLEWAREYYEPYF